MIFPILRTAFFITLTANFLTAQVTGGQHVFQFLNLSPSARITALGGAQIAVGDEDVAFASQNPAVLNPKMDGRLVLNHNFFISDIQHSSFGYGAHLPKAGIMVHGALQHMNYGEMIRADEFGNQLGTFKVAETAITAGASRPLTDRLNLGLNVRYAFSRLDTYRSSALAADAGLFYNDTSSRFTAGLVVRNAGAQMGTFNGTREELPFDIQIAITKRLKHLPFRFTVLMHHLHQWNIRYDDPALNVEDEFPSPLDGSTGGGGNPGIDNFFRHFIFSGEFLFGRSEVFRLRVAYNHLRRRELSVQNYSSLAGFSGGVGIKLNRLRFDAGYGSYHLAASVFHIGVSSDLKAFFN